MKKQNKLIVGVIGLGYVGLPLAIEFSRKFSTVAFDIFGNRVKELINGYDCNNEVSKKNLLNKNLFFTSNKKELKKINFFIITVPTPVNKNNKPDLSKIKSAAKLVSVNLKKNDIVVLESTVYPGFSENFLRSELEKSSDLKYNKDFYIGYSPERINPGDKKHSLKNITKVVSSNNKKALKTIKFAYNSILNHKVFVAKDIQTAEAAKVIENTQRDLNIALINELSIIFEKLNLSIKDVLEAASTKWNFLKFYPGLVGGHCISVDPYYLTYISKKNNYNPKVILAGRKINDDYHNFIYKRFLKNLKIKKINLNKSKILIVGLTYKPDTNDTRNSRIFLLIDKLIKNNLYFNITDPYLDKKDISNKYRKYFIKYNNLPNNKFNAVLVSANHKLIKINKIKKMLRNHSHIEHVF